SLPRCRCSAVASIGCMITSAWQAPAAYCLARRSARSWPACAACWGSTNRFSIARIPSRLGKCLLIDNVSVCPPESSIGLGERAVSRVWAADNQHLPPWLRGVPLPPHPAAPSAPPASGPAGSAHAAAAPAAPRAEEIPDWLKDLSAEAGLESPDTAPEA